jgi:hypothetical protein
MGTNRHVASLSVMVALSIAAISCAKRAAHAPPPPPPPSVAAAAKVITPSEACDDTLWNHVYAGDPRRFSSPKDRLHVLNPCITVTGIIMHARPEKDGDFHVTVNVDPSFKHLLNAKNVSGQHGFLVVEPVCENPVTQPDTVKEGSCNGFSQHLFTQQMVNKHVRITGAYVTDMEHGWNEIHPVTSITVIP